jgi:hypothetical protein
VLLLHEAENGLLVDALLDRVGVRSLLRRENLAAHVNQRLDVGVLQTLVFGLDVVDALVVLDVGIEPGDQAFSPFLKESECNKFNPEVRTRNPEPILPGSGFRVLPNS